MKTPSLRTGVWGSLPFVIAVSMLLGACQTPPTSVSPAATDETPAEAEQGAPKEPPTREFKAQAAKFAIDAMELLQSGEEAAAKSLLERTLQIDPSNEIARKLMAQIKADPQQELGSTFFRYSIKPEDSLSKLAQRFLNDRYRFYILARYNDLRVPDRLEVGQVIKIPGKEPPTLPPVVQPVKTPEPAPRPAEPPPKPKVVDNELLIRRLTREAEVCYQRDRNLDCAIEKWGQVLAVDPDNQLVKLKRERAIALREQLHRDGK